MASMGRALRGCIEPRATLVVALFSGFLSLACSSSGDTGSNRNGVERDGGTGATSSATGGAANAGGASAGGAASTTGGSTGAGGAAACPPECFVNNRCVAKCGDTPQDYGCCPCPDGMLNVFSCSATDAGSGNGGAGGGPGQSSCDASRVLCKIATPSCPAMQVPSVVGVCYGPCVPIEQCACTQASDCPDSSQYTCHMNTHTCGPYVN
jgi:hypothetical protein